MRERRLWAIPSLLLLLLGWTLGVFLLYLIAQVGILLRPLSSPIRVFYGLSVLAYSWLLPATLRNIHILLNQRWEVSDLRNRVVFEEAEKRLPSRAYVSATKVREK